MGKIVNSNIIEVVSISMVIALTNATSAFAKDLFNPSQELSSKVQLKTFEVSLSAKALPQLISIENDRANYLVERNFSIPVQISQASPEINQQSSPPILDADRLESNSNPLSFPTQATEVEVDPQQPITLEQAIELALKNNKDIEQARLNVQLSEEELREAKAALYPNLDFTVGLDNAESAASEASIDRAVEDGRILSDSDLDTNTTTFNSNIQLDYNVYTGGQRGANIRRAAKQLRFDTLDLERIVEQIRFDTASDYYDLQNSDAEVNIERAAVEDAQQTLKDAVLLEQAGLGTRFDVLQAEVELAQAQQRLTTAIANQNVARRQLAETLSLGQKIDITTADTIAEAGTWELSLSESIVQAYKNRAELEQFLLQREINEAQREIAISAIKPQVGVFARYEVLDEFDDDVDITDGYAIGANLQWTLFDGGAAKATAAQEETNIEIAETQFANQRNEVRLEVEQAFYGLQANQDNIDTANKAVELAEESLRLARLRFSAGVGTQTEVIDAQTALTQARGDQLSAIISYNQSYIQLQRAVTNLPDNGLFDLP